MYSEDYLMHYGVKGMKWGVVRKKLKNAYMKSNAKTVVNANRKDLKMHANIYNRASKGQQAKGDRLTAKGDTEKAKMYYAAAKINAEKGKAYMDRYKRADKYLSDIKSNTLQAGKDYIYSQRLTGFNKVQSTVSDAQGNALYRRTVAYY